MDSNLLQLINERHSVRAYKPTPIEQDKKQQIEEYVKNLCAESKLDIRYLENAQGVFGNLMLKFVGWKKLPPVCIAFVGNKTPQTEEKCGYFGEKLVLFLQSLGLNTCWVGMFKKAALKSIDGDTIITIAVGYGENNGVQRRSKTYRQVTDVTDAEDWFKSGVECALKAPTAINQQRFFVTLENGDPKIEKVGNGPFVNVDLGIVKYHFEVGSGKKVFQK